MTMTDQSPADRLSARLRARRKALGITQDDAARRVGVKLRTWQRWEKGDTRASLTLLPDLAKALETTPEELLGVGSSGELPRGLEDMALEDRLAAIERTQAAVLEALRGLQATLADPDAVLRAADELLREERREPESE